MTQITTGTAGTKSAILELLKEIFNGNEIETAERLFESVWGGYKLIMLADEEMASLNDEELENFKEMFRWWFMGGFNAKSILGS